MKISTYDATVRDVFHRLHSVTEKDVPTEKLFNQLKFKEISHEPSNETRGLNVEKVYELGLCIQPINSVVVRNNEQPIFCSRPVHKLDSDVPSYKTFCTFHAFCYSKATHERSVENKLYLEDPKNNQPQTFYNRCSSPRMYTGKGFIYYCTNHQNLVGECNNVSENYHKICDAGSGCDKVFNCFKARTFYKNKCHPFTEDNGHCLKRSQVRDQLKKCMLENPKKYKPELADIRTFFEPTVIDLFNDTYQYYANNPNMLKKGGASRKRSKVSKRRKYSRRKRKFSRRKSRY